MNVILNKIENSSKMVETIKLRKVDTQGLVEMYIIDNFLTEDECNQFIKVIDQNNQRSTVVKEGGGGVDVGRTSYSSFFDPNNHLVKMLDARMFRYLPEYVPFEHGETPQGQKYNPGQFFNDHHDYFQPDEVARGGSGVPDTGQRNWTFMINLNTVDEGGETDFAKLNVKVKPKRGQAVIWKNINNDGSGNPFTLHAGRPPVSGDKYIITKWFRTGPMDVYMPEPEKPQPLEAKTYQSKEDLPHFNENGFELRDLPADIWGYIQDIYTLLEPTEKPEPDMKGFIESDQVETASTYFNMDHVPHLKAKLHQMLLPMHQEWAGKEYPLKPATCYGIRSYRRGATLVNHHDRVTELHVSGIICVDENSNEPWPLHIQDHQGNWHQVIMRPGQILLYESATCMHGRPTPFNGEYYRNFYIHYELKEWTYVGS